MGNPDNLSLLINMLLSGALSVLWTAMIDCCSRVIIFWVSGFVLQSNSYLQDHSYKSEWISARVRSSFLPAHQSTAGSSDLSLSAIGEVKHVSSAATGHRWRRSSTLSDISNRFSNCQNRLYRFPTDVLRHEQTCGGGFSHHNPPL